MEENRDLDVVIEAGKTLMESGAEIFRVEETMRHMARVMEITEFDAYTVTGGIMSSGLNKDGERVSRVANVPVIKTHLGRLEAVNSLSRDLERNGNPGADVIRKRIEEIRKIPDCKLIWFLVAYFCGAGGFAYAMGSSVIDSLAAAVTGLILGVATYFIEKIIHTTFLVNIIGSMIVTLFANLFCYAGFGEKRGLIILGAFMIMVPGAVFVNSVREYSENNYATGTSHLMSALLTSISMAVAVAAVSKLFPFTDMLNENFAEAVSSPLQGAVRVIMAGVGTLAFAALYNAPLKYYPDLGLLGAGSWLVYLLISEFWNQEVLGVFAAASFVSIGARVLSVKRKCPMTMFLSTSIFPLFPGITLYRGIYFLLTGHQEVAYSFMKGSFLTAFMIALAIALAKQFRLIPIAGHKRSNNK